MTAMHVRLFGPLRIVAADGADLAPRSRKARALAVHVLLAAGPVSRERLATLLWGDSGDEQARASLRQALYELRALTAGDAPALLVSRDHVARGTVRTDLDDFEALARDGDGSALADALERAAPVPVEDLTDVTPDFDAWLAGERTRLLERLLSNAIGAGRDSLARAMSPVRGVHGAGRPDDGRAPHAAEARRLADALERVDPLDERVHRFALAADAAGGDLAAVHRRHRRFRERLAAELGTRPSGETQRAFEALTRGTGGSSVHDGARATADSWGTDGARDTTDSGMTANVRDPAPEPVAAPASAGATTARPATSTAVGARPRRTLLAVAALMIAAVALVLAVRPWQRAKAPSAAAAPAALAVLAFVELPSRSPDAYFASGVSEEIRNLLARDPKLRVLGAESAGMLAGGDSLAAARRAGVTHLLEGTLRAAAGRMIVDARLVAADEGRTLWSQRFDRPVADVFAVQNEIALAVAGRLQGTFAPAGNPHLRTEPEVYDRYLAARRLARERRVPDLQKARGLLLEAVALDPEYAPAYASLAQVTMLLTDHPTSYGTTPFAAAQVEAKRHAARALVLAPELGDAHAALGLLSTSDLESLPHFERAVALDPQRAEFHRWLGAAYDTVERPTDALREFRYGAALEPLWWLSVEHLVAELVALGRDGEATTVVERFERLSADPFGRARVRAGLALREGRLAEYLKYATAAARAAPGERTGPRDLATAWALLGERARALAALPDGEPLGRLVLSHDIDGLAREALALGDAFWFIGADTWGTAQALLEGGRGDVLLRLYDASYRNVDAFYGRLRGAAFSGGVPLAVALRDAGRTTEARALARLLQAHLDRQVAAGYPEVRVSATRAALHAAAGERDAAQAALERTVPEQWFQLVGLAGAPLDRDPTFAPWRDDPRLRRVRDAVGSRLDDERRSAGLAPLPQAPH